MLRDWTHCNCVLLYGLLLAGMLGGTSQLSICPQASLISMCCIDMGAFVGGNTQENEICFHKDRKLHEGREQTFDILSHVLMC